MKIKIELDEAQVRKLIVEHIRRSLGEHTFDESKLKIEVNRSRTSGRSGKGRTSGRSTKTSGSKALSMPFRFHPCTACACMDFEQDQDEPMETCVCGDVRDEHE